MTIQKKTIEYSDSDNSYQGLLVSDTEKQAKATVLISHTWAGRDQFVEGVAEKLVALGYQAFAIDMYGDAKVSHDPAQCEAMMKPLVENRELVKNRINLALETLKSLPEVNENKVFAIGYCFGGLCVLDLARSNAELLGVVSFHGLLNAPQEKSEAVQCKVLVLHGHDDPMVPVKQVNELKEELTGLGVDWQIHAYGNTVHAFTNKNAKVEGVTMYNETSDQRSWQSMLNFFEELL